MESHKIVFSLFIIASSLLICSLSHARETELFSPDENIKLNFVLDQGQPQYEVSYKGVPFINVSDLGFEFKNQPPLKDGFKIVTTDFKKVDETWESVYGTASKIRDHYNELTVELEERAVPNRKMNLVFRVYDNGIAFRYMIPKQERFDSVVVMDERTTFNFASDYTTYGMDRIDFKDNYEQFYKKRSLHEITEDTLLSMPFLIQLQNGWASLTEAALTEYTGMSLSGVATNSSGLISKLAPIPESNEGEKAIIQPPFKSPWMVILLEERVGDLITSNLLQNLNEPNKIADTSFIKPGQMLFPWWNGLIAGNLEYSGEPSTEVMKYYIDFAAEFGIPHLMVDAGWYSLETEAWEEPEQQNLLTMEETRKDYYDISEIIEYGNQKGVQIHLWVHLISLKGQVEKVLSAYADWGVAGIKVDSFGGDDQQYVADFQHIVKVAAENKLMVNFHGAYKPTGWSRTYPNLVTREAVMANEHTIWQDNRMPDATHNVTIPYTRMAAGPMDYTPGAFDLDGAEGNKKYVKTTRAQQIAMFVVYYSPLQMIVDYPAIYRQNRDQFTFLTDIPTVWDETKFIEGDPGEYIIVARRSGVSWYVGAMTNDIPRDLSISMDFLEEDQNYHAQILSDAKDADRYPENVEMRELKITSEGTLSLNLQKSGGGAVILTPVD
ncbi:MAG: hypothetical protein GVY07_08855 [Bacteroidetes bacterium]|jgi:alpha-glucosidase|nr:hypothetical protein [Bacteroidota bacterium]